MSSPLAGGVGTEAIGLGVGLGTLPGAPGSPVGGQVSSTLHASYDLSGGPNGYFDHCDDSSWVSVPAHYREASLDEDDDCVGGGKKRKVPVALVPGSEIDVESGRDGADRNPPRSAREEDGAMSDAPFPLIRRLPRSTGAKLVAQRRELFQKRKARLVALYLDAQGAVEAPAPGGASPRKGRKLDTTRAPVLPNRPTLPDVGAFERLLPVLEDIDVWAPDAPGWREGNDAARLIPRRTLERWRTGFARRKRQRLDRMPVHRGGWAPEGSFELDIPTVASTRTRSRARERVALARLAEQLRSFVLASNKLPTAQPSPTAEVQALPPAEPAPVILQPAPPKKGKKKKKKRTTLANEGNPHHVDKYRPSRPVPISDPYEPWPHHASLLLPPSMRILAARPGGRDIRPGDHEYICVSCQYALFYGSERLRKEAIKQRKAELARREKLRARVLEAGQGNRSRRHSSDTNDKDDEEDEEDYEDGDEDAEGDECHGAHGRCTCGRAIKGEAKPPDKPP